MSRTILVRIFGEDSKFAQEPLAVAVSLFLVLVWAGWYVISRWGVTGNLTPADIMMLRYVVGVTVSLPFFLLWKNEKVPWKPLIVLVPAYGVVYLFSLFYGLKYTPVANAGVLINGTLPIINGLLALVLFKGTLSKTKWYAIILLGLANGCMFISGIEDASLNWGWGLILIAALSIGTYMTVFRQYPIPYRISVPLMAICNFALFLPIFPFLESNLLEAPMVEIISQGFFQGIVNQVLVVFLIAYAIPRLGSVTTSVIYGLIPATTAIMGWAFLDESVVFLEMIGIVGCTIGIVWFGRSK